MEQALLNLIPKESTIVYSLSEKAVNTDSVRIIVIPVFLIISSLASVLKGFLYIIQGVGYFFVFDFKKAFKKGDDAALSFAYPVLALVAFVSILFSSNFNKKIEHKLGLIKSADVENAQNHENARKLFEYKRYSMPNFVQEMGFTSDNKPIDFKTVCEELKRDIARATMKIDGVVYNDFDTLIARLKEIYPKNQESQLKVLSMFYQTVWAGMVGLVGEELEKKVYLIGVLETSDAQEEKNLTYSFDSQTEQLTLHHIRYLRSPQLSSDKIYGRYDHIAHISLKTGRAIALSMPVSYTPFSLLEV